MTTQTQTSGAELIATIDVRELHGIRWGMMRQMFPKFVEEIELGRYLRELLVSGHYGALRVEPHQDPDGSPSTHIFGLYRAGQS
jgi:hypothetical protein